MTVTSVENDAQEINFTLVNDGDADTLAGLEINATSAATGDADNFRGISISDLTNESSNPVEYGLYVGQNWDYGIYTDSDVHFDNKVNLGVQNLTVTDDGAANDTLSPVASYVQLAQDATADAGTPNVVISETNANDGDLLVIVRTDSNAGDFTISDSAGVTEIGATETFGAGEYDTLVLIYVTDRWVQIGGDQN
jgi:hypothetical protein